MVREALWRVFMKASKGKEFIQPDPSWFISERKSIKKDRGRTKKYYINKFNRKVRKIFLKLIKEYL